MFDLTALLDGVTMSAEDKAMIGDLFKRNPDAVTSLQTKATEYVTSAISEQSAAITAKQDELDAEWSALKSYRGGDEAAVAAAEQRIEKLTGQLAVAKTRLESTAKRAGYDVAPLLKDIDDAVAVARTEPKVETPMFDEAAVLGKAGTLAWNAVTMNAALNDIAQEHFALFGTPLPSQSALLEKMTAEAKRTNNRNITPREVWMKEFGVEAKRVEITEAKTQDRIKQEVAKALETERSENALRITRTGNPDPTHVQSPIFSSLNDKDKPVAVQGVPESVVAAIGTFRKLTAA